MRVTPLIGAPCLGALCAWVFALSSCTTEPGPFIQAEAGPAPDFADVFVRDERPVASLAPREHLIRLSLDLRGIRPSVAEYERLEAAVDVDAALAELTEEMLASQHFPERVKDLWAAVTRTRIEDFQVEAEALGLDPEDTARLQASIGEEPLALLADLVARDRPLTELVTAPYTMVDALLADLYPVSRLDAGPGWVRATYTDGRPAAGWLTMNGLWLRYLSDGVSWGRGRANAIARIFLCADFLDRPIDFPRDFDLTDEDAIRRAVREDDACIGCHASLDPLASHLAGFQYTDKTPSELFRYHPERERLWPRMTGLAPGYYGRPGYALTDLALAIASDPRFVECLALRGYELFSGKRVDPTDTVELDALTVHRERLLAGGLTMKALARTVVSDARYADAEHMKIVPPEMWSDVLFELTGYRAERGGRDVFSTDTTGLRTLAGGGDGRSGAAPSSTVTATMALAWERSAEAAAAHAVTHNPGDLFTVVAPDARPEGLAPVDGVDAIDQQIRALHRRLFGTWPSPDSLEIRESRKTWNQVLAIEKSPARAWTALLSALLRDPTMVTY